MSTVSTKKSSAIAAYEFDPINEQVILRFVSNPDKPYIYGIDEGEYDYVVNEFSNAESYGTVYHKLVNDAIISLISATTIN